MTTSSASRAPERHEGRYRAVVRVRLLCLVGLAAAGFFAYGERDGRLVELARVPEATNGSVSAIAASSDGTRVAIAVAPLAWTTDRWVEPVPARLLSFSEESGFAPIASFSVDTDAWPPRGWHVDLAMSASSEDVVARSEPRAGPTRTPVLRTRPSGSYEVSPIPALSTGLMPDSTGPVSLWRRESIWLSPDGTRVAWISGNERDEMTLAIADITEADIEERWTGFPAGVEGAEGCSTPWSARSAAFSPYGRQAVAAWCASTSCPRCCHAA